MVVYNSIYNSILKIFILFIKFFYFIKVFKWGIGKIKLYYLIFLYNYIKKLNNIILFFIFIKRVKSIKVYLAKLILKLNFLGILKKYILSIKINKIFTYFYVVKFYNKIKKYVGGLSCILNFWLFIYKIFYIKSLFNYFNVNKALIKNFLFASEPVFSYDKFSFFYIKKFNKLKKSFVRRNNSKIKLNLNNLFSLFFYNLLIYFFIIYLFIFWLNTLLKNITPLYLNNIFLLNIFNHSRKLFFYKEYVDNKKKKKFKKEYYLKNLKLNKYYYIYNKLNLLKFYNIF